jgi:uridine kinase
MATQNGGSAAADADAGAVIARSMHDVARLVGARAIARRRTAPAFLVGISGIDGSGKTHLTRALAGAIELLGLRVATIGVDPWQHPQSIRFGGPDRGRHFYEHAIRFDDLFATLVDPLVARRSLRLATRGIRTDSDVWHELVYDFENVDVVLLEGIFLFRRDLADRFDLRVWIECSFETAVQRALARNVEGLPAGRLVDDYARIYHAAQRHHFAVDAPRASADFVLPND